MGEEKDPCSETCTSKLGVINERNRAWTNAAAIKPELENGEAETTGTNHDTMESKEMEVTSTEVKEKVEITDCSKSVPSVNTSYETCILSNVTAGPLGSPADMEDTEECREHTKTA